VTAPQEDAPESPGGVTGGADLDHKDVLGLIDQSARVFEHHLAMQNAIAHQQAIGSLRLAVVAKCADVILALDPRDAHTPALIAQVRELLDLFETRLGAPKLSTSESA
jgi:hypothetical protein